MNENLNSEDLRKASLEYLESYKHEGYTVHIIPAREKKSCWGCKYYDFHMLKSGMRPEYARNCKHPDAPYQGIDGNIPYDDDSTPEFCPVGEYKPNVTNA